MLSASSPAVVAFTHAFEENQNVAGHPVKIIAEDRRKYIAIDEVDKGATPPYHSPHIGHRGGRFLIDRGTGVVHSIKGYGKAGYRLGTVTMMALRYREASRTFDPSRGMHVEIGHAKVATTSPVELRSAFRSRGQGRKRTVAGGGGGAKGVAIRAQAARTGKWPKSAKGRKRTRTGHAAAPHRHSHRGR